MAVTLYIEYVFLCKKVRENHNCIQREFIQLSREFCMHVYVRQKLHKRIIFIPSNERDAFMFFVIYGGCTQSNDKDRNRIRKKDKLRLS